MDYSHDGLTRQTDGLDMCSGTVGSMAAVGVSTALCGDCDCSV